VFHDRHPKHGRHQQQHQPRHHHSSSSSSTVRSVEDGASSSDESAAAAAEAAAAGSSSAAVLEQQQHGLAADELFYCLQLGSAGAMPDLAKAQERLARHIHQVCVSAVQGFCTKYYCRGHTQSLTLPAVCTWHPCNTALPTLIAVCCAHVRLCHCCSTCTHTHTGWRLLCRCWCCSRQHADTPPAAVAAQAATQEVRAVGQRHAAPAAAS
jgi:hypothetical protein